MIGDRALNFLERFRQRQEVVIPAPAQTQEIISEIDKVAGPAIEELILHAPKTKVSG